MQLVAFAVLLHVAHLPLFDLLQLWLTAACGL
jgi:hypothetical protein